MAYVVAISAFFVVAAFGMFIKYDCGNGAQLEAMASEARAQKQAQFAVESRNDTCASSMRLQLASPSSRLTLNF